MLVPGIDFLALQKINVILNLLAVPFISLSGRSAKANITMDAGLLQAIDHTARARGLTRSAFLADIARREISGAGG